MDQKSIAMRSLSFLLLSLLLATSTLSGQNTHVDTLNTIFHTSTTPIWEYTFLRNTAKEFLENANRLETRLLNMKDRWADYRERRAILQQGIATAQASEDIAGLGVDYAQKALEITTMNADIAQLRVTQKDAQIQRGFESFEFMKKKHDEIANSGFWKWIAAGVTVVAGTIVSVAAIVASGGAATPMVAALVGGAVGVGGTVAGGVDEKRDIKGRDAITERQTMDQLLQMARERVELDSLAKLSQKEIVKDRIAYDQAVANQALASLETNQAKIRLMQFDTIQALNSKQIEQLIGAIEGILYTYLEYSIILAKLTEKAYQAEEVVVSNHIKSLEEYLTDFNGDPAVWLAAERILLDLNTIEFNRITEKKQRPNFTTYTLSLRAKDPIQLEELRQTGRMIFDITQFELDSHFPGSYARTIKKIDVQVIALAEGGTIKGQITKEGLSWKKVPEDIAGDYSLPDWFQFVPSLYRSIIFDDEDETLIFPRARGIQQTPGLLDVFVGKPVSGTYSLEVPKYSNNFDFNTIVDVIITIDFASYFDHTLKSLIEKELCEMSANGSYINGRELQYSMHLYQPDDWYEFRNPPAHDENYQKRRYFPIYIRHGDVPNYHLNSYVNSLSIGFMTQNGYTPIKFSLTNTTRASSFQLADNYGLIDPMGLDNLPDDIWWKPTDFSYPILSDPLSPYVNDSILYLYSLNTSLIKPQTTNIPDSLDERFELWLIKVDVADNPGLSDGNGLFDEDKLAEIDDVVLNMGYRYDSDFCTFSGRTYAWMDVDEDTTQIAGIDGKLHHIPYLYAIKAGHIVKAVQKPSARFSWKTDLRDSTFFLDDFINKDVYDDLVPFYSFVGPKTMIEEVEISYDLESIPPYRLRPLGANITRSSTTILYCEPTWIKLISTKNPDTKVNTLHIEVDNNIAEQWNYDPITFTTSNNGEYDFGKNPITLKFRYLSIPDDRGLGKIDIFIKREDGSYERVFKKGPIFRAWRPQFQTQFSLRLHRDDFPDVDDQPNFILRDIKFKDLSRF